MDRTAGRRDSPATRDAAGELTISMHDVPFTGLPEGLDGCRVVQLTDLHWGCGDTGDLIEAAVGRSNALAPEYVLLTGDLVDGPQVDAAPVVRMLAGLRARVAVYAVLGNHDHRRDTALLRAALEAVGIVVLQNRALELARGFWLAGTDDLFEGDGDIVTALRDVPDGAPGILLSHNPRAFDRIEKHRPLVILSGHTHGGQWHLPLLPPVAICLWHLHTRFVQGWYRGGALRMYVNRGIGVTGPNGLAVRVNCPPEVALFVLRRSLAPS